MRKKKKIRRNPHWTPAEAKLLGKIPDSVLARRNGRFIKDVVAERERRRIAMETGPRRWTGREIRLLGTMNDSEVARRLRRPKHHVRNQRIALNIPPFKAHPKGRPWTAAEIKLLGQAPDAELA